MKSVKLTLLPLFLTALFFSYYSISLDASEKKTVRMLSESFPKIVVVMDDGKLIGGGCIVSEKGDIITNFHVAANKAKLQVRLFDGKTYGAVVHKSNELKDLAWLKIATKNEKLPFFKMEDKLPPIGTTVFSIGHPFRIENSVTKGIVSGTNRSINFGNIILDGLLQVDAALNPGSSGGALVNKSGLLVGINCGIYSGADNLGVCIPIFQVKEFMK